MNSYYIYIQVSITDGKEKKAQVSSNSRPRSFKLLLNCSVYLWAKEHVTAGRLASIII